MELYDNTDLIYNEYIKNNFVSKVKIQDKIKELKEKYENNITLQLTDYNEWIRYTAKVCVLNELLEEE